MVSSNRVAARARLDSMKCLHSDCKFEAPEGAVYCSRACQPPICPECDRLRNRVALLNQCLADRDHEIARLNARVAKLEAVRREAELICKSFYMGGTTNLRQLISACQPAP